MKISLALNKLETEEVFCFFKKLKFQSHYNNPSWASLVEPNKKPIYIRFYENSELAGFAIIYTRISFCVLKFGPAAIDNVRISEYLYEIAEYLKSQNFGLLTIQLPYSTQPQFGSLTVAEINRRHKIYSDKTGWNTILIPLSGKTPDDVFKSFSKGHKSSIKKAIKEGLIFKIIDNKKELERFSEIFNEMHLRKNLIPSLTDSKAAFNTILDLNLGTFAGVYKENELIGGVLFVSEGTNLLYKFGATDSKYNNIPILHLAIFEMIKLAIESKFENVDLCGFLANAKPGSPSYGINIFKKGFGGEVVEYPESFSIRLNFAKAIYVFIVLKVVKIIPPAIIKWIYTIRN